MPKENSQKPVYDENKKRSVLERLWLTYYNDTLFSKGMITEEQRNKMRVIINKRHSEQER